MSDQPDKESKTESPSEKKISDAVGKGNTPFSREIVSLGSLVAIVAVFILSVPSAAYLVTSILRQNFENLDQSFLQTPSDAANQLRSLMQSILFAVVPALMFIAVGGVVGSLIQNIPAASWDRVKPKWERLSPSSNMKRVVGKEAFIEFAKTGAKFTVLCALIYRVLQSKTNDLLNIGLGDPSAIPGVLRNTALDILTPTAIFVFLLAIADIVWTRLKWWNDLKMTRQELKEEHKSAEGDPLFKQKRRMIAQKRLKTRMMADVPKATLVVVNPTHYAVALRYVPQEGGAPVVLAKGLELVALKIREISTEHEIPIVEDKSLARSLYSSCEVGEMIPPEYYKAVAEIIHFIERKRQLAKSKRTTGTAL